MIIKNGLVYQNETFSQKDLRITDGIISEIGQDLKPIAEEVILHKKNHYIVPGFIDIHTHGAVNVDINHAKVEDYQKVSAFFASHGTTSWLCSILTDTKENTLSCIKEALHYMSLPSQGANLLGIHLEGPFLSEEYRGSMPQHLLKNSFDFALLQEYQECAKGNIRYITLSPEIPNVNEAINQIHQLGIKVAIGHSGADYATAMEAIQHGADAATHVMNAMRLLHQHEPAILGAILESDIFAELICDGLHLHPGIIRLLYKIKGPDQLIAITDSIMATGLPDGNYQLGANAITVSNGDAKVAGTSIRAGSTLTQDKALRNLLTFTKRPLEQLLPLLTSNPVSLLELKKKGALREGYDADIVILDENYQVTTTFVHGETV